MRLAVAMAVARPPAPAGQARLYAPRPVFALEANQHGFSLVEMLIVVAMIGILAGMAVGVTPTIVASMKGQSGVQQVAKVLTVARETAITRRRNVEVRFQTPRTIEIAQVNVPGPGTTVIDTVQLEGGVEYARLTGLPDTPVALATGAAPPNPAIWITSTAPNPVMFTTEGTFVDANGDPVNASLFFAINQQPGTASAATIFGTTALIRTWRWDGAQWVE